MIKLHKIRFHFCVKCRFPKAIEFKHDYVNNACFGTILAFKILLSWCTDMNVDYPDILIWRLELNFRV